MLPENELRDRVTTDVTTKAGSFDVVQIGTYETPVWGKNGWLAVRGRPDAAVSQQRAAQLRRE